MSKSILVVDTPEKCDGCILHGTMIGRQICCAEIKRIKDESKKPDWCPLKKIPTKYAERDYTPIETKQYMEGYEDGYNDCIDNILKERDGNG